MGSSEATSSSSSSSSSSIPIDSSNIGFKLLQKHGWKEGTGLGISEQGRLEPLQASIKTNKRGLGAADNKPNKLLVNNQPPKLIGRKESRASKKMKKMQELEKQRQEKEFDQAFFREFWPDNV